MSQNLARFQESQGQRPGATSEDGRRWGVSVRVVFLCFFFSGVSALIYEVAWLNRIQLVMGHTVYSLATTLVAYLAGLALGSFFAPRLYKSGLNSLFLYFCFEALIGIYGICFSPLLSITLLPYSALVSRVTLPLPLLSLVQFLFCGSLIFIPTFFMGTTLPLLLQGLYGHRRGDVSKKLSSLYAANTVGASIGALLTGFVFLPQWGYQKSVLLAAGLNLTLVLIALMSGGEVQWPSKEQWYSAWKALGEGAPKESRAYTATEKSCFAVLFVSGLSSMMAQIIWNRIAALGLGPSCYLFPLVTSIVLLGIFLGSAVTQKLEQSARPVALGFLPILSGLSFLLGTHLLTKTPWFILEIHQSGKWGFAALSFLEWMWLAFVCLIPSAFLGSLFPLAASALAFEALNLQPRNQFLREQVSESNAVAMGSGLNILGLIMGALLGGFVLMPILGIEGLTKLVFLSLSMTSISILFTQQKRFLSGSIAFLLGAVVLQVSPKFDWYLLTSGFFYNRVPMIASETLHEVGYSDIRSYVRSSEVLLVDHQDDPHATISIHAGIKSAKDVAFKINGKVDGNNSSDLRTTRFVALLPALLRTDYESALTIGLGTGSTVSETLRYPKMQRAGVIELSQSMIEFSKKYFSDVSGSLWKNPKFFIENRDGRDYLEHNAKTYDLIISEPSNPWVDGVGSLFTQEYYELIARRLSPHGVAALWFHSYGLDCSAVRSVLAAAATAFPSLYVFRLAGDLYMLGSNEAMNLKSLSENEHEIEKDLFQVGEVGGAFLRADAYRAFFQKNFLFDRAGVLRYTLTSEVNRDDTQFLQFHSGQTFFQKISCNNFSSMTTPADSLPYLNQVLSTIR